MGIEHKIDEFKAELDAGTSDPDNFMSLTEIEKKWPELNNETGKIYSDIVSAYLCSIDERAVIKSKKRIP